MRRSAGAGRRFPTIGMPTISSASFKIICEFTIGRTEVPPLLKADQESCHRQPQRFLLSFLPEMTSWFSRRGSEGIRL